MPLNEQQQRVATSSATAPLKVVAGAGTGKTETVAARFVELVRGGISPSRIVLLTFTEDAAAEMRARVMLRLREAGLGLATHALLDLWCHTFHGFAARLVRQYGFLLGLPPAPLVLDKLEQAALRKEIIAAWEREPGSPSALLAQPRYRWEDGEAWDKAMDILQQLRGSGASPTALDPHPLLRTVQEERFSAERAQLIPLVEHAYAAYTAHLRQAGLLDYDELIVAATRLLDLRPEVAQEFATVMVDEFQDTDPAQLGLLQRLRRDWSGVTVVGDPRQAIFGWRAARPDNLREFPFLPGASTVAQPLQHNYRSRPAICAIANLSVLGTEFEREAPLVAGRPDEVPHTALQAAPAVSLHLLPSIDDEATLVASEMRRLIDGGLPPADIALLLRQRTHLRSFAAALQVAGVPFVAGGGTGFFRQPAVRLVASLLDLLADPESGAAAVHVLESPLVGLDLNLLRWSTMEGVPLGEAACGWLQDPESLPQELPERELAADRLVAFRTFYDAARARSLVLAPPAFLVWLFQAAGLRQWWREAGAHQALRDLDKLIDLADSWSKGQPDMTTAGYTSRLGQQVKEQPDEAVPIEKVAQVVEITTIHRAKGREWPVVFVADTQLPSKRSTAVSGVLWDAEWGLVISDGAGSTRRKGVDPLGEFRRHRRRYFRNEERAIWYVALTRARDRLVVTHSRCEVDDQGHFEDVSVDGGNSGEAESPAVHFFHELWEQVRGQHDEVAETVVWEAGAWSGVSGVAPAPSSFSRPDAPIALQALAAAWEAALGLDQSIDGRTE